MRINEVLFLLAGLGILISLPFFIEGSFTIWFIAKGAYFVGVIFYVFKK